jgi:tetratricopeptide (TPR) repeat protein
MARRKIRRSPGDLPQRAETWHVMIQQLRTWITPPDEEPSRPFVTILVNLQLGIIQSFELLPDYPSPEQLLNILFQAMQKPPKGMKQKPHRPQQIQLEDESLATALTPELETLDIQVQHHPRLEGMDEIIRDLEDHLRGGRPEQPGLLSVEGVTPELVGGLFAAAAEFHRAAPWVQLTDQHVLAVRLSPEKQPRFVMVMGNAGVEYGLAVYRRWEDVERLYSFADDPLEMIPPEGAHSLFFDDISLVPFDDLEAIEQHGWEVVNEQAYPIPVIYTPQGEAKRPSRADLLWYEAALRAIPIFLRDHLRPDASGDYKPAEVTLNVPTHSGQVAVDLKYPGGTISKEKQPVDMMDWSDEDEEEEFPHFDRRGMEGMMSLFGGGFDDPDLDEAQELMYQAWEERNPARRIILAHEALEISPDCADAYVLLAEEEADTLGRALEYYRQGVEAGERALGESYFEENVGHFWGLLETRPYMRARQGLANTLWELGRHDEAADHYHDLLRLNPGDNQGIRYSLLNLLVGLARNAEAQTLLAEYEEDGMAEWLYTRALLTFRAEGISKSAQKALQDALEQNPHVPPYLTGRKRVPNRLPPYIGWGDENEAKAYASSYLPHWRRTPGAVDWLKGHLKPLRKTGRKSKKTK